MGLQLARQLCAVLLDQPFSSARVGASFATGVFAISQSNSFECQLRSFTNIQKTSACAKTALILYLEQELLI